MFIHPSEGRITSPFGLRTHPKTGVKNQMHWGVDYGKDKGTRIVAAASGKVVRARTAETDAYGKLLILDHTINGQLYSTVYAHLASFNVKDGQTVKQGDTIAVMGTTGLSTGVHLHFEIHIGKYVYTKSVDPLLYIVDAHIKEVQALLVKAGYNITIDGIAGVDTTSAIKTFQKVHHLTVDGIAGSATIAKLKEVTTMPKTRYSDVSQKHSAYGALERLSKAGVVNGYEDGTFRPNESVTRAHMVIMLDRALNGKG